MPNKGVFEKKEPIRKNRNPNLKNLKEKPLQNPF